MGGGPFLVSLLCLIQAEATFEVGGRFESRVGRTPINLTESQTQLLVMAMPILNLRWSAGIHELNALAYTRVLWRPVPLFGERPLLLQTVEAAHTARLNRRTRVQSTLRGSYGEEDYTSLSQRLPTQPSIPLSLAAAMVDGSTGVSWSWTRRSVLGFVMSAFHRRTLDRPAPVEGTGSQFTLPNQTTVMAMPSWRLALTRSSAVQLSIPVADYDVRGANQTIQGQTYLGRNINYAAVQPQLSLFTNVARRHQLQVTTGIAYAIDINNASTGSWVPLSPLALVELNSFLLRSRPLNVRTIVGGGTNWFADPFLGVSVQRASAQAAVFMDFGPSWTVGLRGSFLTDVSDPLPTLPGRAGEADVAPDETIVAVDLPVRYLLRNFLVAEFGGRYSGRGPHLERGFSLPREEYWAYVSVYTLSRVRRRPPS